jgi:uncharacterized repeat protein (TIGR01451 family)
MKARKDFAWIMTGILCLVAISKPIAFGFATSGYSEGWNASGDLAGWEANTTKTNVAVMDSGGNPGGYLYTFGDIGASFDIGAVSRLPQVTGDYGGTTWRVSFDLLFISGSFDNAWLRFRFQDASHNGWLYPLIPAGTPMGKWTHFEVFFDPAWSDSEAIAAGWEQEPFSPSWSQTMSNVFYTEIRLSSEGFSEAGIDNFTQVATGACVPPPPDLVSWWPGDGNANDIGDGNDGTPQNGATFAPGMVGQAFSFDGVDDVVVVPDSPNLNFNPASPITVDLWAFRTGTSPVMHLVGKRSGCAGGLFNYQMALNTNSGQGLQFGSGFGPGNEVATGIDLPLNTWTHLVGTFDGSLFQFYINGQLVATSAGTLGPTTTAPFVIGGSGDCARFAGLIDEVEIYNRALSSSEIQAIYNAGSAGKCKAATGADLAITKTVSPNPILTGSNLTYAITVTNNGPGAAANVTVMDNLPASTTFVSCSATSGGVCDGSGNNRTVTFTSLAAGESATITLVANVNCPLANGAEISNTAAVSSTTPDPDTNNNSATANVTASNPPPVIANPSANPSVLWPPNHKMVDVTVNYKVLDNCGPVTCTLSVSSNEPVNGTGDGDTAPDWEIVDAHHVRLRAERAGNGIGRVYTITITCRDSAGNSSNRRVTVRVPKSQGEN